MRIRIEGFMNHGARGKQGTDRGASKSLTPAGIGKEGSGLDHGGGEGVPSGAGGEERAEAGGVDGEAEEERLAEQVAEAALPASATRGGDGAEEGDAAGVGGRRPGRQVRKARRDGHDAAEFRFFGRLLLLSHGKRISPEF
jgi:hypothetical protein